MLIEAQQSSPLWKNNLAQEIVIHTQLELKDLHIIYDFNVYKNLCFLFLRMNKNGCMCVVLFSIENLKEQNIIN